VTVAKLWTSLFAVALAAVAYFLRWVVRTAAGAPGLSDQRPTRTIPRSMSARDRARLAAYSARRFRQETIG